MSSCGVFAAGGDHTSYVYSDTLIGEVLTSAVHYNFVLNLARCNANSTKVVGRTINIDPAFLVIMTNDFPCSLYRHHDTGTLVTREELNARKGISSTTTKEEYTLVCRKRITCTSMNKERMERIVKNNWQPFMARSVVFTFAGRPQLRNKAIFHEHISPRAAIAGVYPLVWDRMMRLAAIARERPLQLELPNLIPNILCSLWKTRDIYLDHIPALPCVTSRPSAPWAAPPAPIATPLETVELRERLSHHLQEACTALGAGFIAGEFATA